MAGTNREDIKDISYILENSPEQRLVREGDDLIPAVKKTIGDYLSCLTKEGKNKNEFPLKAGSEDFSLHDADGNPVALKTGGNSAEKVFAEGERNPQIEQYSDSGQFIPNPLRKGQDGHTFLKDIRGTGLGTHGSVQTTKLPNDPEIVDRISDILIKNNRFHPEAKTPFVPRGTTASEMDNILFATTEQKEFGVHNKDNGNVRFSDLRKVGLSMMLKACGEFVGADGDPVAAVGAGLIPGAAQLAISKIDPASMYASNAFSGDRFRKDELIVMDRENVALNGSYGNLNNFQEPFGGAQPVGMTILAEALILALRVALEAFLGISKLLGGETERVNHGKGPFTLGVSNKNRKQSFPSFSLFDMGFVNTKNNYLDAVDAGIDLFFEGADLKGVAEAPGFYAVFVRAIIRSSNEVIQDVVDVANAGNVFEGIQSAIGVIDKLKRSKIFGFSNILAQMGDTALEMEKLGIDLPGGGFTKISSISNLPNNAITRVMKSRIRENDTTLAWRNSSSPSSYLLPASLITVQKSIPNTKNMPLALLVASTGKNTRIESGRLSNLFVQEIENELDSEYVPFYFHDLRTNEIISFHAFLSAITDNFNVNYESSSPYGRIDPIRIYKNTERTINIEFNVVSTNKDDFNEMWWKVNKLMTMIYPQWSKGRKINVGDPNNPEETFYQPFSQIPKASPLIRLRLGDIFKTNYSKFALARLFGLGQSDFKVKSAEVNSDELTQKINDEREKINKLSQRVNKESDESITSGGRFKEGEFVFLSADNGGLSADNGGEYSFSDGKTMILPHGTIFKVVKENSDQINGGLIEKGMVGGSGAQFQRTYELEFANKEEEGAFNASGKTLIVPASDLQLDTASMTLQIIRGETIENIEEENKLNEEAVQQGIVDFFSAEKNAIVRSFESVLGKGLAGFITSISFDWNSPRWETDFEGRAPQYFKVSMGFAPIHDIPPGIDSDGFNRGALYKIGDVVNSVDGGPYQDDDDYVNFKQKLGKVSKAFKPNQ